MKRIQHNHGDKNAADEIRVVKRTCSADPALIWERNGAEAANTSRDHCLVLIRVKFMIISAELTPYFWYFGS